MTKAQMTATEARDDFSGVLDRVAEGDRVVVTRNGRRLAALVPLEDLERLEELEEQDDVEAAKKALAEPERYAWEDVKREARGR